MLSLKQGNKNLRSFENWLVALAELGRKVGQNEQSTRAVKMPEIGGSVSAAGNKGNNCLPCS